MTLDKEKRNERMIRSNLEGKATERGWSETRDGKGSTILVRLRTIYTYFQCLILGKKKISLGKG